MSEFDIEDRPRSVIKGQVLADFIVQSSDVHPDELDNKFWVLENDRSSKAGGGGVDMVSRSLEGVSIA